MGPSSGHVDTDVIAQADAIINLSGAGIGDRRWSQSYRKTLLDSRTLTTSLLASTLASLANDGTQRTLLNSSAIGIYGARGDEEITESSQHGDGFRRHLPRMGSRHHPAEEAGVRAVHLRTGIVMSKRGGVLKKLLPLFKLGLGGRLGSGRQWQSWISIDDEVGAIVHLLSTSTEGAVNLTAPNPGRIKSSPRLSVRRCVAPQSSASPASLQSFSWDHNSPKSCCSPGNGTADETPGIWIRICASDAGRGTRHRTLI